ncbi:SDR family NAD(P)-dependent oxidoreductase [Brevibacterium litoralis]|uniref:SDR family NAD(P)-dependent oxidoreductase n=1 Tax=Brevibacterium litoralis TaxID=3138935 RepID=UPI0032F07D14
MQITPSSVAIVTGGASGIGRAIARAFVAAGGQVLIADLSPDVHTVAADIGTASWEGDCSSLSGIEEMVAKAEADLGPVDFFFANAGIVGPPGLGEDEDAWDAVIDINTRQHVRAAKVMVPKWQERGGGYFVSTASAAGLLTQLGQLSYSVTKHATVGFAEWLNIAYGDEGIRCSVLCPQGVNTPLLNGGATADSDKDRQANQAVTTAGRVLEPEEVAQAVLDAIEAETFLILPHPEVLDMYRMKGSDYDRWLRGMRRYQKKLAEGND